MFTLVHSLILHLSLLRDFRISRLVFLLKGIGTWSHQVYGSITNTLGAYNKGIDMSSNNIQSQVLNKPSKQWHQHQDPRLSGCASTFLILVILSHFHLSFPHFWHLCHPNSTFSWSCHFLALFLLVKSRLCGSPKFWLQLHLQ